MKALSTNRLVQSKAYEKIIDQYNEILQSDGKVNGKQFFEKYVAPEIPSYSIQAWYNFLKRFKKEAGLEKVTEIVPAQPQNLKQPFSAASTSGAVTTLMTNQVATSRLIQTALHISADRAREILEHPELLTAKEAVELGLKAMKAQDSRIHAVGKLREDNREQEKFDRAFSAANGGE